MSTTRSAADRAALEAEFDDSWGDIVESDDPEEVRSVRATTNVIQVTPKVVIDSISRSVSGTLRARNAKLLEDIDFDESFSDDDEQEIVITSHTKATHESKIRPGSQTQRHKNALPRTNSSPLKAHNAKLFEGVDFDSSFSDEDDKLVNSKDHNINRSVSLMQDSHKITMSRLNSSPLRSRNAKIFEGVDFDEAFSDEDDTVLNSNCSLEETLEKEQYKSAPLQNLQRCASAKLNSSPLRAKNAKILEGIDFDEAFSDEDTKNATLLNVGKNNSTTNSDRFNLSQGRSLQKSKSQERQKIERIKQNTSSYEDDPFGSDDDAEFLELLKKRRISKITGQAKSLQRANSNPLYPTIQRSQSTYLTSNSSQPNYPKVPPSIMNSQSRMRPLVKQPILPTSSNPITIDLTLEADDNDKTPPVALPRRQLPPPQMKVLPGRLAHPRLIHTDSSIISINAPETSSPEHHRTATTGKRVEISGKDKLYPSIPNYERILPESLTFGLPRMSTGLEGNIKLSQAPDFNFDLNLSAVDDVQELPQPPMEFETHIPNAPQSNFDPILSSVDDVKKLTKPPKEFESHIPKLPAKRNAEVFLMTQKPNMASISKPSNDKETKMKSVQLEPLKGKKDGKTVSPLILSEEQQNVIELILKGSSVFYTGSAGTGKSVLLRSLIKRLHQKYQGMEGAVGVCASTGLASVNVGGLTLHSYTGVGLGQGTAQELAKGVKRNRKALARWRSLKVLIIDEISMIDGAFFDKLDEIACDIRKNDQPFGGIQIVCCGDFFQLPPVSKEDAPPALFCFESYAWKRTIKHTIVLKTVFRQKGDLEFIDMLNEMRLGKVSEESAKKFRALERPLPPDDIEAAELYSTRWEVDRANNLRLNGLRTEKMVYTAIDSGLLENGPRRENLLSGFIAPKTLTLKKGAQVMMLKNLDESLVNGSLGKVIDFIDKETYLTYQKVQLDSDQDMNEVAEQIQRNNAERRTNGLPVKTSTEESVVLEDTVFDFLLDTKASDPQIQDEIKRKKLLMKQLNDSSSGHKLPLVKFLTPDGQSRCVLVAPETWTVEDEKQEPLVSRVQIPLMLAWAISIHKSQGQTLPRVRVNLRKVFEKGQVYVAISRAVSREGLQVLYFDPYKVLAHEKVIAFYKELQSIEDINQVSAGMEEKGANTSDPGIFDSGLTREGIMRDNSKRMKIKPSPTETYPTNNYFPLTNGKNNQRQQQFNQRPFPSKSGNAYDHVIKAGGRTNGLNNRKTVPVFQRRSNTVNASTKWSSNSTTANVGSHTLFSPYADLQALESSDGSSSSSMNEEDTAGNISKMEEDSRIYEDEEEDLSFVDRDSDEFGNGNDDTSWKLEG